MQGKKDYQEKLFLSFQLSERVPLDNFYRLLDKSLDLRFLYKFTKNINSDRKLIEYCSDSLAVRLYLRYDLDESLSWHNTICCTRQLYGEELFLSLFRKVLSLCVAKRMVSGRRQAVDSAFIKANASLDSLVEKEVLEDVETYANELNEHYSPTKPDVRISTKPVKLKNLNFLSQVSIDTSSYVQK